MPDATLKEIITKSSTLNNIEAESIARSFVANNPDNDRAWEWLLLRVSRNRHDKELLRLSLLAHEKFPSKSNFRYTLISSMLKLGKVSDAEKFINDAYKKYGMSINEALVLAEILLIKNSKKAKELYSIVSKKSNHSLMLETLSSSMHYANKTIPKVAFLLPSDWHFWIMKPIADALLEKGVSSYFTDAAWKLNIHKPDIIVLASLNPVLLMELRQGCPKSIVINTNHSISVDGKNFGLYAASAPDFICVSSRYIGVETRRLALLPKKRVLITGYPAMDNLFIQLKNNKHQYNKTVLFVSTFNPEIGAIYMIGEDPVKTIRGDDETIRVILTAHPHFREKAPEKIALLKEQAKIHSNVEYFDSATKNIADKLFDIDVLIHDISSVGTQFLATGRPLISLLDEQKAKKSGAYAPYSTEWIIKKKATFNVSNKDDLHTVVKQALALAESGYQNTQANKLKKALFENFDDGCSGERIAENIVDMISRI